MTDEEFKLWYFCLKKLPYHFRRQAVFGSYIVDFYCAAERLVIEVDGSQHYSYEGEEKDKIRDNFFADIGIRVLRYSNIQINTRFKDVCDDIYAVLTGER